MELVKTMWSKTNRWHRGEYNPFILFTLTVLEDGSIWRKFTQWKITLSQQFSTLCCICFLSDFLMVPIYMRRTLESVYILIYYGKGERVLNKKMLHNFSKTGHLSLFLQATSFSKWDLPNIVDSLSEIDVMINNFDLVVPNNYQYSYSQKLCCDSVITWRLVVLMLFMLFEGFRQKLDLSFLVFLIIELRVLPGGQIGFTCNDPALSHPFTGDTITWKHLFATILLLPLAVMLIVEQSNHRNKTLRPKKQALKWYKEYVYGVLVNLILVQSIKQVVGSPRPHFFDTCSPAEALICQDSEYVPRYTCTKAHWLTQSDRSFPSGHTGLALHAGIFLAYYLYKRATRSKAALTAQAVCLLSSAYCGWSRMWDHRHHWWDVLGGALISLPIILYTIFYLCNDFKTSNQVMEPKTNTNGREAASTVPFIDIDNNL